MARLARVEVFAADEVAVVHVMNRTVRRCFLMGEDRLTGRNYDHRKGWVEEQLKRLAGLFGIDLLCHAVMSNHFHLVVRSRPDVVAAWDDAEVARRWWGLCPGRKDAEGSAEEPKEHELRAIASDAARVAVIRNRLSDISWWMRLLCQNIGQRANRDDGEIGKFWQARYRAVRLLDETALLACAAYVDLNPIRAALAETLEGSDYTSGKVRAEAVRGEVSGRAEEGNEEQKPVANAMRLMGSEDKGEAGERFALCGFGCGPGTLTSEKSATMVELAPNLPNPAKTEQSVKRTREEGRNPVASATRLMGGSDGYLAPVAIDPLNDAVGPCCSPRGKRASEKGFLPMSAAAYLELLDWTARQVRGDKRGSTPAKVVPLMERLGISDEVWCGLVKDFGRLFYAVAGKPHEIDGRVSRDGQHRFKTRRKTRELLVEPVGQAG
jgi:hypothetical protein